MPDHIGDCGDQLLTSPILCKAHDEDAAKANESNCTQFFKIIPQELAFYRSRKLALPRHCHNCRHHRRLAQMNSFQLWQRQCAKCAGNMQTTYAPERPEKIYCENCYLQETY